MFFFVCDGFLKTRNAALKIGLSKTGNGDEIGKMKVLCELVCYFCQYFSQKKGHSQQIRKEAHFDPEGRRNNKKEGY